MSWGSLGEARFLCAGAQAGSWTHLDQPWQWQERPSDPRRSEVMTPGLMQLLPPPPFPPAGAGEGTAQQDGTLVTRGGAQSLQSTGPPWSSVSSVLCRFLLLQQGVGPTGYYVSVSSDSWNGGAGGRQAMYRPGSAPPPTLQQTPHKQGTDWATPIGAGGRLAEPKPSSTPHLALEHEPGGPQYEPGVARQNS